MVSFNVMQMFFLLLPSHYSKWQEGKEGVESIKIYLDIPTKKKNKFNHERVRKLKICVYLFMLMQFNRCMM